jgi:nitroimidazol reductase NimA-like FMN-containing flavoprotein (pyridoxamine 5'-phosphate oxidase superfamily)
VPIGYFRRGDEIFMGCRHTTQKTRNVERNPKVSLLIESGSSMQDIKGLLIQGEASVVVDDAERLELMREAARQRGTTQEELPSEASAGGAYIRVRRHRVISWDYAR